MTYRIYIKGNYFFIIDENGKTYSALSKEVEISTPNESSTSFVFKNVFDSYIDISNIRDENNVPYTLNDFVLFYTNETGNNTGGGNGEGVTQADFDALEATVNTLASPSASDAIYTRRDEILDEGLNLYNKNDSDNDNSGWLNSDNVVQAHATATHTKYFPLTANQDYWYLNAYGASTNLIIVDSSYVKVRNISGTVDGTFTVAASGEAYVRFSVRDVNDFMFAKGSTVGAYEPYLFRIKPNVIDDNQFKDKGIVLFGDSITWFSTGWSVEFERLVSPQYVDNMAVSGQRITWNNNTVDTGTAPANDSGDNNVLWNSIKGWEATNTNGDPDAIIIAIGTNDISQGSILGSFTDAFVQDEASTTQLTMANAFRKALYYLKDNYPNTQIFYCTPVQSKTGGRNYTTITNVGSINSEVANRANVKVIDVTNLCGISDEFENASAVGRYLYDGTHPSHPGNTATTLVGAEYGAVRLGRCIANEFKNNFYI